MLPLDQIDNIRQQLISRIEQLDVKNKEEIKKSVMLMNPEQLEDFLEKNNLIKNPHDNNNSESSKTSNCIFCSIISGDIESYKISENKDAIAVLEINPVSKGHVLMIPKKHLDSREKIPASISSFAKKISKKIKAKFKPKEVKIYPSNLFGHEILNLLPIYKDETLDSERTPSKKESLEEMQKILEIKQKTIRKSRTKKIEKILWLPKRIP